MAFPNHYAPSRRTLDVQTTDVATGANTTETDLFSTTLKGGALKNNGQGVRARLRGKTGATANNKTIKLYFGGVSFFTTGAVAANNKDWHLDFEIIRTGVGTQDIYINGTFNATLVDSVTSGTVDETADNVIKATGTNGTAAAADITGSGWILELL